MTTEAGSSELRIQGIGSYIEQRERLKGSIFPRLKMMGNGDDGEEEEEKDKKTGG